MPALSRAGGGGAPVTDWRGHDTHSTERSYARIMDFFAEHLTGD